MLGDDIVESVVLGRSRFWVGVFPVFFASKLFNDVSSGDELLELLGSVQEVDFCSDDGVEIPWTSFQKP